MKTFKSAVLAFVLLTGIVACAPDKKEDPVSTPANTDDRDKYVGHWLCNEVSKVTGPTSYTINITKSSASSTEILIDHFYDLATTAKANVSGTSVTIPYQQLGSFGFAAGSGTLSTATQLNLTYTTNISGNKDTCTASCVKQ
ncbi:MAG: hypothetical protein JST26_04410 [Bacteroidetes bacterium]|nr:hypothetical protein [Bacteroidota bacterium]